MFDKQEGVIIGSYDAQMHGHQSLNHKCKDDSNLYTWMIFIIEFLQ